jgi:hypothetical protein
MIEFVLRAAAWGLSAVAALFHRGWKRIWAMFSDKGDFPPTAGAFARSGPPCSMVLEALKQRQR